MQGSGTMAIIKRTVEGRMEIRRHTHSVLPWGGTGNPEKQSSEQSEPEFTLDAADEIFSE